MLDVREEAEFAGGHISARAMSRWPTSSARVGELDKFKDRPVIVCCANGKRATAAVAALRGSGFANVVNLAGGFAAWQQAGLPVEK